MYEGVLVISYYYDDYNYEHDYYYYYDNDDDDDYYYYTLLVLLLPPTTDITYPSSPPAACSLNTDILLGLLSRIVGLRRRLHDETRTLPWTDPRRIAPLKLIVMSATLRVEDLLQNRRLFPQPPPLINVPARQYPVTIHFNRVTEMHDYVGAAYRKVTKIHRELPRGGILVFLTGQREVEALVTRLRQAYPRPKDQDRTEASNNNIEKVRDRHHGPLLTTSPTTTSRATTTTTTTTTASHSPGDAWVGLDAIEQDVEVDAGDGLGKEERPWDFEDVDDFDAMERDESESDVEILPGTIVTTGDDHDHDHHHDSDRDGDGDGDGNDFVGQDRGYLHVLPLYAMLPAHRQAEVFQPPPDGSRLVIVATNVAETSLTIPNVRYVVDAGRSKQRLLDVRAGLSRFEVRWISQASAAQRAGRAGRTGPGHCYRLYSSAHFQHAFPEHAPPEISTTPLDSVVLSMYAMGIQTVERFPFPTPPPQDALRAARATLVALSALDRATGMLTPLGHAMAAFPVSPRHARMMLEACRSMERSGRGGGGMGGEKRDDDDDDDDDEEQEEGEERRNGGYERKRTTTIRPNPGDLHVNRRTMVSSGLKQSLKVLKYSIMLAAALSVESPFLHADAMAATSSHQREDHDIHVDGAGEDDPDHAAGGTVTPHDESDPSPQEKKKTTTTTTTTTTRGHQVGKDLVHARQAAFRCDRSDALGSLRALCAFEKAGETEHFARLHHLHARHLREMAALHRQLASIVTDVILVGSSRHHGEGEEHIMDRDDAGDDDDGVHHLPEIGQPLAPTTSPHWRHLLRVLLRSVDQPRAYLAGAPEDVPRERTETRLRRSLAAGWADRVARRVQGAELIQQLQAQADARGRKRLAVRYQAYSVPDEPVYLHPNSSVSRSAPDFVVYLDVLATEKRPYLVTATAVDARWLPAVAPTMCRVTRRAREPPPHYVPRRDAVAIGYETHVIGVDWPLPIHHVLLLPPPPPPTTTTTTTNNHGGYTSSAPGGEEPDLRESAAGAFACALLRGYVVDGLGGTEDNGRGKKSTVATTTTTTTTPTRGFVTTGGKTVTSLPSWSWVTRPEVMLRGETRRTPRAMGLVLRLVQAGVRSRAGLVARWRREPTFLCAEVGAWLEAGDRVDLPRRWAEVVERALGGGGGGGLVGRRGTGAAAAAAEKRKRVGGSGVLSVIPAKKKKGGETKA